MKGEYETSHLKQLQEMFIWELLSFWCRFLRKMLALEIDHVPAYKWIPSFLGSMKCKQTNSYLLKEPTFSRYESVILFMRLILRYVRWSMNHLSGEMKYWVKPLFLWCMCYKVHFAWTYIERVAKIIVSQWEWLWHFLAELVRYL